MVATIVAKKAAGMPWRWPANEAEVPRLADQWLDVARSARTLQIQETQSNTIGFLGGKSPHHTFLAKHVVRAVLLQMERQSPLLWTRSRS
ncbi:MAG: hypothetical protein ACKPKO_55995, partial [Candidatus Fonsibacter sp.]